MSVCCKFSTVYEGISSINSVFFVTKGSVARVDRRLRRYYLIVRLLPNTFALACLSLSLI